MVVNSNNVLLAIIVATKGLKGEVKLKSFTDNPLAILDYDLFDEAGKGYIIEKAYIHKNVVIAKLAGINSIEEAEVLINTYLYTKRDSFEALEAESYYHIDLIDLEVLTLEGEHFGKVSAVFDFGAGDVLEIIKANQEKVLINFTKKNVVEINLVKKYIKIISINYIDVGNHE